MPVDFAFLETSGQITLEWTIRDFGSLPRTRRYLLTSPPALVGTAQLFIRMYPGEPGHIVIGLGRKFPTMKKQDAAYDFKFYHDGELMAASDLQKYDFRADISPMALVSKYAIFHSMECEQPGFDLRIVCSISVDGAPRLGAEADSQLVGPARKANESIDALLHHLRDLFLTGDHSDLAIRVGGREFRAHRALLAARSPVFGSMFRYDTLEKASGAVCVQDCDPEAFEAFLEYLYTGQVGDVDPEVVPGVYVLGARYDVPELRREAVRLLRRGMSPSAFCEVLLVASAHEEEEDLMRVAEDFFIHNFKQVFRCPDWKELLAEHPALANRLFRNVAERREAT